MPKNESSIDIPSTQVQKFWNAVISAHHITSLSRDGDRWNCWCSHVTIVSERVKKKTAFFGSSLPLDKARQLRIDKDFSVNVPLSDMEYTRSSRFLSGYARNHAYRMWFLESKRFASGGFRACHPLAYDRNWTRQNARNPTIAELCSVFLSIACNKKYTQIKMIDKRH